MKRLLLVTILMAMAIISQSAFAQLDKQFATQEADSCNMTLLDEWECPTTDEYIGNFNFTGIDNYQNYVFVASYLDFYVLEMDSNGILSQIWMTDKDITDVVVKDTLVFCLWWYHPDTSKILVYNMSDPYSPESLSVLSIYRNVPQLFVEDTILYTSNTASGYFQLINISEPTSPFLIGSCELTELVGNPYAFYAQYPYIYIGGYESCGDDPMFMWEQGELLVMNVENIDSPYTVVNRLSEHGELYHPSFVKSISVKDSFVYAIGYEHIIEQYYLYHSTMYLNFLNSYYDSAYGGTFSLIENNKLFISSGDHFHIFDITSVDTTILTNYYNFEDAPITIHNFLFEDFCVKDSFVIALGTQLRADTAKISVLKFDPNVSSISCSLNQKPSDYKLETYPNPFNSTCEIYYSFDGKNPVNIGIYDIGGKFVAEFTNIQPSGTVHWDGSGNETGVYLIRASSGESVVSKKIVYIR